jgi:hypothetical protein
MYGLPSEDVEEGCVGSWCWGCPGLYSKLTSAGATWFGKRESVCYSKPLFQAWATKYTDLALSPSIPLSHFWERGRLEGPFRLPCSHFGSRGWGKREKHKQQGFQDLCVSGREKGSG